MLLFTCGKRTGRRSGTSSFAISVVSFFRWWGFFTPIAVRSSGVLKNILCFHLFFSILRPFPPSRQIAFKLWEKFPALVSCWTMGQIGRRLSSVLDSSGHQTAITFHKTARYGNRRATPHLQLSLCSICTHPTFCNNNMLHYVHFYKKEIAVLLVLW